MTPDGSSFTPVREGESSDVKLELTSSVPNVACGARCVVVSRVVFTDVLSLERVSVAAHPHVLFD